MATIIASLLRKSNNPVVFFLIISFVFHPSSLVSGLSFKLIHRDSLHLYPGNNLSYVDRIRRLIHLSESRVHHLESLRTAATNNTRVTSIRPPVDKPPDSGYVYVVQVSLGTPSQTYYLELDTGSSLIWLQCKPCNPCFPQNQPAFDPTTSSTYNALPCNHVFCQGPQYSCVNNQCNYNLSYLDTSSSKGVMSTESFSFPSEYGSTETLKDVIFGCGYNNVQPQLEGDIDGVLGMNIGKISLFSQIKDKVNSRFSYCLIPVDEEASGQSSFLRFGDDIVIHPGSQVQTTPFYMYYGDPDMYSVNLLDISVGDAKYGMVRVGIEPGTFTSKPDGKGGCLIDSGAAITYIDSKAYIPFKQTVMAYFERLGLKTITNTPYQLDLCYIYGDVEVSFPSIIFHFQGADFTVRPEFGFLIDDYTEGVEKYFCLGMRPRDDLTLIGSMQQQNTRFIFDTSPGHAALSFVPEDCSQDAQRY